MSLGDEGYTVDQLYDMVIHPDKLKAYPGFQRALSMGIANQMGFYHDLPYDEIKEFIGEEKEVILSKVTAEVMESNGIRWEHIGSTSIKGMPGTIFPDSLILCNTYPPPREVFDAIMDHGFTFIGAGPIHPSDLWFLKKISREGSRLHDAIFKIHLTPADLGPSKILIETRDRCNANPADFEDYKNAKVEAAKHLESGNVMKYKGAKMSSKLLQELAKKHGIAPGPPGPPK